MNTFLKHLYPYIKEMCESNSSPEDIKRFIELSWLLRAKEENVVENIYKDFLNSEESEEK